MRILEYYGRFVGLTVLLYAAWMFGANVIGTLAGDGISSAGLLALVLVLGLVGLASAIVYLRSFDGPVQARTKNRRTVGWLGMLITVLLPTSISFFLAPMVLIALATLFISPESHSMPAPAGH